MATLTLSGVFFGSLYIGGILSMVGNETQMPLASYLSIKWQRPLPFLDTIFLLGNQLTREQEEV
jgi:hypothetical protein